MKKKVERFYLLMQWLVYQLALTFSAQKSFFSSKRIERGLLFIAAYSCSMYWFWTHVHTLKYTELIAFVSMLFLYAGYTMRQSDRKKLPPNESTEEN
jgi:Ca2+/Na+ antiporter